MSAPQPSATVLRLACDCAKFDAPQDLLNNLTPKFWVGSNVTFQLGLFVRSLLADVSNLTSLTLEIKALNNGAAPDPSTAPLVQKVITSFDNTLADATWADGSKQHVVVALSDTDANQAAGDLWLLLYALNGAGERITFAAGKITAVQDGGPSVGDPAPATPTFLSAAECVAQFEALRAVASVSVTGALTPDAGADKVLNVTMTGAVTLHAPTNPADGLKLELRLLASGADRALTLNTGDFTLPASTALTSPITVASGTRSILLLDYCAATSKWLVVSYVSGY